jgi:hypothetical protein
VLTFNLTLLSEVNLQVNYGTGRVNCSSTCECKVSVIHCPSFGVFFIDIYIFGVNVTPRNQGVGRWKFAALVTRDGKKPIFDISIDTFCFGYRSGRSRTYMALSRYDVKTKL